MSYIVALLLGGVIGYITNDIAIRMLFRPHKARYLFGIKIPFTPGIIPKEKGRIASAIGGAISENLMNKDILEKNLLSDEMIAKMQTKEYVIEIKDVLMEYIKDIDNQYRMELLEIMESGLQYEKTRGNMKDTVIEKVEKVFEGH